MHDTLPFFEGEAREALGLDELLEECVVDVLWLINLHILLIFMWFIKVETKIFQRPIKHFRHVFA